MNAVANVEHLMHLLRLNDCVSVSVSLWGVQSYCRHSKSVSIKDISLFYIVIKVLSSKIVLLFFFQKTTKWEPNQAEQHINLDIIMTSHYTRSIKVSNYRKKTANDLYFPIRPYFIFSLLFLLL